MKKLFLIALTAMFISCSSDDDSNSSNSSSDVAYFTATVDGASFNYRENNSSSPSHYHSFGYGFNGNGFDKSFYYSAYILPSTTFSYYPSIDVTLHNMFVSTSESAETDAFYGLFNTLPTNYISYDDDSNWVKGISVTYIDQNEVFYTSLAGSQAGSSITFSNPTNGYDGNLQTVTVTGTVNCKLYNSEDVTDYKTVTNGTFKLIFREYY
ncbi:MAG: hypothetical protein KYX68_06345 [Flavobacterium sp.]|nr:hypothetical protein [Flavobacterium sp.]